MYTIILKDGTKLEEKDITIKEVLNLDNLGMFLLTIEGRTIAVDFETGLFYVGEFPLKVDYSMEKHDFRLIYYKRSRMELSFGGKSTEPHIYAYLLGWQFTENGENHQRIMFWYPETNMVEIKRKR